jgi:hypothetical protein
VIDAGSQGLDIVRIDRRKHPDAQLVTAQLAVWVNVDDPVTAQNGSNHGSVDRAVEVDGSDDQ